MVRTKGFVLKTKMLAILLLLMGIAGASNIPQIAGTPRINIISQTYVDSYFNWTFTQIDSKTWSATFVINPALWSDAKTCTGSIDVAKTTCFQALCDTYLSKEIDCSSTTDKEKLAIDMANMSNYPQINLTANMKFSKFVIDTDKGIGSFQIDFPEGFKSGESAKFGFGSTVVNTTTSSEAISLTTQRRTFYASGRHWVFYSDGTNFSYSTSTDGVTWSAKILVHAATSGPYCGVWFNGTNVSYACTSIGPTYYRSGIPNSDGTISWVAAEQNIGVQGTASAYPSITVDNTGCPWISITGSDNYPNVTTSSTCNGTWTTAASFPYKLNSTSSGSWVTIIVPLSGNKTAAFYTKGGLLYAKTWNGTAWSSAGSSASNVLHGEWMSASALTNDNVSVTFPKSATSIMYIEYNSSTSAFGAESTINSSISTVASLSVDTANNNLTIFWSDSSTNVYYKNYTYASQAWSNPVVFATNPATTYLVSASHQAYSNVIGVISMNGSGSPWNIHYSSLNTPAGGFNPTITITWNYPANNTWNITASNILHGFTPVWYDSAPSNCSVWTNSTGAFQLAGTNTTLTNNTITTILYDYTNDNAQIYSYINCTNSSGTSNYTSNYTIKIDRTVPTTPTITNQSQGSSWVNLTIGSCTDATSGVAKKLLYRDGANIVNFTSETGYNSTGLTNCTQYSYLLGCLDNAGMYGSNSTQLYVNTTGCYIPNMFFNVSWNYPANNTWNTTQTITHGYTPLWYDATMANCSLWSNITGAFGYKAVNATVTNNSVNTITYNYGQDTLLAYSYINCTNSTGSSNFTGNFTIKIDTTAPTTTASPTDSMGVYTFTTWTKSNYVEVALSCSDTTSGCQVTKYCNDTSNTCTPATTYTSTVNITTTGTSYFRYNSTDNVGKSETIKSGAIMIDTDLPTTTPTAVKDDASSYTFNTWAKTTYVDVTLTGADATSGLSNTKYCADSTNTCTPTTVVMAPVHVTTQGTSYVRYYSTDNAGNTETVSSVILKIDSTAPVATATAVNNDSSTYTFGQWTVSLQVNVTLTCSDTGGSGCFVTYYCADTGNTCTPNAQYTVPVEITTNGSSFIRFNSTDNVGNYGIIQSKNIMIDPEWNASNTTNFTAYDWEQAIGKQLGSVFGSGAYCFGGQGENCTGGYALDMGGLIASVLIICFFFIWTATSGIAWDGVLMLMVMVLAVLSQPGTGFLGFVGFSFLSIIAAILGLAVLWRIFRG